MDHPAPTDFSPEAFNRRGVDHFPGHLGIVITHVADDGVRAEMPFVQQLMAPAGRLATQP